jgi:hypothetical protein
LNFCDNVDVDFDITYVHHRCVTYEVLEKLELTDSKANFQAATCILNQSVEGVSIRTHGSTNKASKELGTE